MKIKMKKISAFNYFLHLFTVSPDSVPFPLTGRRGEILIFFSFSLKILEYLTCVQKFKHNLNQVDFNGKYYFLINYL